MPPEVHNTSVKTQFRRAVTRFRNLTYQPDMGKDKLLSARVRSMLADTHLCSSDSPPLRASPLDNLSGIFYLLFFDGGSRRNSGPGGARFVIVQFHIQTHAACVLWVSSMAYDSANATNNVAEYGDLCMEFDKRRLAATHLSMSWGIVQSCFRNSGRTTLHASNTWRCYFERQE